MERSRIRHNSSPTKKFLPNQLRPFCTFRVGRLRGGGKLSHLFPPHCDSPAEAHHEARVSQLGGASFQWWVRSVVLRYSMNCHGLIPCACCLSLGSTREDQAGVLSMSSPPALSWEGGSDIWASCWCSKTRYIWLLAKGSSVLHWPVNGLTTCADGM